MHDPRPMATIDPAARRRCQDHTPDPLVERLNRLLAEAHRADRRRMRVERLGDLALVGALVGAAMAAVVVAAVAG